MAMLRSNMMRMAIPSLAAASKFAAPKASRMLAPKGSKMLAPRTALAAYRFLSAKPTAIACSSGGSGTHPISDVPHFHQTSHPSLKETGICEKSNEVSHHLHPIWSPEELLEVEMTHHTPVGLRDKAANAAVQTLRFFYDLVTGYTFGKRNEMCYIRRIIFLETIAGVPGMVGGMVRHFNSLRRMERDYGWIHTLLEEAENERMHLMTAMLLLEKPSFMIRWSVLGAQWIFLAFYTTAYITSPKFCHRMVGYIEEEAVKTYTGMVNAIDAGKLPGFLGPAHESAIAYWQLPQKATFKDVVLCIRADETHHREVNHTFAAMQKCHVNPFRAGY